MVKEKETGTCKAKVGTLRLYGDRWNVWITREIKNEKTGKTYEKRIAGYSPNVSMLAESFLDSRINDSDAKTFKQMLKELDKARKEYLKLLQDFAKEKELRK